MKPSAQRISKGLFYLALLPLTLGLCAWQGWAWWSWAIAPSALEVPSGAASPASPTIRLEIPQGTPSQQIGRDLEAAGLIRSASAWNLWSRLLTMRKKQGGFQAGTYEFSTTQSLPEIAAQIWAGQVVYSSFTIPEGWSLQQMAAYFEAQSFFKAQDFLAATRKIPQSQYPWLPANLPHLEGFLYPDTYQLQGDKITPQEVIQQMLNRFEQVALPVYQKSQGQPSQQQKPLSLLEWVTLASIVEKEAVIPSERSRISGVFTQRLKLGMTLGSDPTVEYGLGVQQTPDQPLTLAQVNTASPYNTYINPGLPPTPIASPGLASLEATLAPEKTDYLYFVARYDGTHVFSRTLEEHEAAQITIQDQQAARRKAETAPTASPVPSKL
ncbi:MAG: endolytic transglycosylase MltG [Leptolyngbyaceae bacterium]|nr:endolytic transglycosylase MltG [Leptolyngbyaceae bacterium]